MLVRFNYFMEENSMRQLSTQGVPEAVEAEVVPATLCCGAPDAETSQRLHRAERRVPRHTPRPLRLADIRRVM